MWELLLPSPADLLLGRIYRWLKKRRVQALEASAKTWPMANGRIMASTVKRVKDPADNWRDWQVELTFSYIVQGEYYSGTSLLQPETEDEAAQQAKQWNDRSVTVRYWPDDLSKTALLMEDQTPPT